MSLRGTLSQWIASTMINKYGEGAVAEIETVFCPFTNFLSSGCLKLDFLDIYLTTSFGVRNFRNISAMGFILFWNFSKFDVELKNSQKNWEKVFCFLDKCIWIGRSTLSLLRREDLSSPKGVSKNRFKTLDVTKTDPSQLSYHQNDQWIW